MTPRRTLLVAVASATALAACASGGSAADVASDVALTPLPTVGGVGVLPSTVPPNRAPLVVVTPPVREDGTTAEPVGEQAMGNRLLVIGDSIMASTATRYSGYMCDALVPLGWAVEVEAEKSRFIDFGNRVLDKVLDPVVGTDDDWDAAAVFLGSNYGRDQERYEAELRMILTRLAPRPTLLYTVGLYRPEWAEVNETIHKLAGEFENVTVVDWEAVTHYPGVLSADDLHPTDGGRHILVDMTAQALGPATLGAGECIKSKFTDDSAGNGSATGGSGSGSGGSSTGGGRPTATTVPRTTVPNTAAPATTTGGGGGGGGGGGTTVPPATSPPTTGAPATTSAPATLPPVTAPPVTSPPVTAPPTTAAPGGGGADPPPGG